MQFLFSSCICTSEITDRLFNRSYLAKLASHRMYQRSKIFIKKTKNKSKVIIQLLQLLCLFTSYSCTKYCFQYYLSIFLPYNLNSTNTQLSQSSSWECVLCIPSPRSIIYISSHNMLNSYDFYLLHPQQQKAQRV